MLDLIGRGRPTVAIVADMLEEGWWSMDLVADKLVEHLKHRSDQSFDVYPIRPALHRRFSRPADRDGVRFTFDRLLGRFVQYPRILRDARARCDLFHIVDHSYSQLLHAVGGARSVVTCHDLDTFESVLDPARRPRSRVFRMMTRRILDGFVKANHVVTSTSVVRDRIIALGLARSSDVSVLPYGVDPTFSPGADPAADAEVAALLGPGHDDANALLHVGSTIPRKRIDLLLRILLAIAAHRPGVRLIRVGGPLPANDRALADELGIASAILEMPPLGPRALAAVYRRARVLVLPSEAEGFGLPVVEAMASGTPVVASALPTLQEVGGNVASYVGVGDIAEWAATIAALLHEAETDEAAWDARRARGIARARAFSWTSYASRMAEIYTDVLAYQ